MEMLAAWQALRRYVLRQGAIPTVPKLSPVALPVGYCNRLCVLGNKKRFCSLVAFSRDSTR